MNLTQQKKLVSEERKGASPTPGHDVVVFRLVENGLVFERLLQEGEVFEPKRTPLFGKPQEYASRAVNKHPNLRHTFTQRFDHKSGGHSFDLTFTLFLAVADPKLLVANFINDPLKMIQDYVEGLLGAKVAATPWEDLEKHKVKEDFASWAKTNIVAPQSALLQADALRHGIRLHNVEVELSLTGDDVGVLAEKSKREREQKLAEIELARSLEAVTLSTTVEDQKLTSQLSLVEKQQELARLRKLGENDLRTLDREQKMQDALVDAAGLALRNMGEDTRSPEGFMRASEAVARTFHSATPRAGGPQLMGSLSTPGGSSRLIAGAAEDPLVAVLRETLEVVGPIVSHGVTGRELVASVLHLIAEFYRGSNTDEERLAFYREDVTKAARDLNNDLSTEQYTFVRKLLESESIREKLSGAQRA